MRERTDDGGGDDGGQVSDDLAHATPTHWAVDPLLLASASWMKACEGWYVYLDPGFAKQIIEHGHSGSWRDRPGSALTKGDHGTSDTPPITHLI